jgi:hypothetical protein
MYNIILFSIVVSYSVLINSSFVFSFNKSNDFKIVNKKIEEKNKKRNYSINVNYPQIAGFKNKDAEKKFNEYVEYIVTKDVNAFKKDMNDWEGRAEMESTYEIADSIYYMSDDLISIRFDGFVYYSGAAHPLTFFYSLNYDLKNNSIIELSDIFQGEYLKQLSAICVEDLIRQQKEYLDNPDSSWILEGAGPKEENYKVFNFTKTYFLITFPVYQVASYAEGPKEVIINYGKLLPYIKTDGSLGRLVNE